MTSLGVLLEPFSGVLPWILGLSRGVWVIFGGALGTIFGGSTPDFGLFWAFQEGLGPFLMCSWGHFRGSCPGFWPL